VFTGRIRRRRAIENSSLVTFGPHLPGDLRPWPPECSAQHDGL